MKTDNELIAEFMGWESFKEDLWHDPKSPKIMDLYEHYEMRWKTSWDWLMPVIQKIDLLNQQDPISLENYDVAYMPLSTPINEVYEDVIEFIKWYNQLKEVRKTIKQT